MRKVFFVSIAAGLVAMAMVVARAQEKAPATQGEPKNLVLAVVVIADAYPEEEYVFTINNAIGFKTIASLKKYIGGLPAGSTITWAPSDVIIGNEPLRKAEEVEDFTAFCKEKKVKLVRKPAK